MKAIGPTNFIAPLFELVGSQFDSRIIQQSYLEFIAGNSRKQHLNLVVMAAPISARCITLSKGKMDEDATDNPLIAPLRFHLVGEILGPDEPRRAMHSFCQRNLRPIRLPFLQIQFAERSRPQRVDPTAFTRCNTSPN
jgi:hypothetical protein